MVAAGRDQVHRRGSEDLGRQVRQEGPARDRGPDQRGFGGGEQLMAKTSAKEHVIGRDRYHFKWDNTLAPAVEIDPGDIVHFSTEEVTAGQLNKGDPATRLGELDFNRLYPLGGPVFVRGAEPGDALEVEILDLRCGSWGWAALFPGLGLRALFSAGDRHAAQGDGEVCVTGIECPM